jgi:S1-C subfamily serine protease
VSFRVERKKDERGLAAKAGLKSGDILIDFDGVRIESEAHYASTLCSSGPTTWSPLP